MRKLLVCIICGLLSSAALAEVSVNTWLERLAYRGVEIEHIRVMSEKPLVALEEPDAEVDSILEEAKQLESDSDNDRDAQAAQD